MYSFNSSGKYLITDVIGFAATCPKPQIDAKVNECERLAPAGSLLGWGEQ